VTSVPPARSPDQPHGSGSASATRTGAARRALGLALLFGAAGAALTLVASGQVWSHSTASFAQGELPVKAKGSDVTGLPSALALVGLAALVAVFAVRRRSRVLVAGLLTLCGTGALMAAVLSADDRAPLADKAAKASGLAHSGIETVHVSAWPYLSAVGGALLLIAGVLALRYGPVWPSMSGSRRYERNSSSDSPYNPGSSYSSGSPETSTGKAARSSAAAPVDPDRPEDLWKALDRGEDPTGDPARAEGAGDGSA
jgi:uncharacterized membrane protein (TIGR02234 family)